MKKDKLIMAITISIMSLILACVMFAQFKVVNQTDIAQIESMREDELREAITEWKEKYEKTAQKIVETNNMIKEYEDKLQSNEETKELVKKELAEAKENFGLTDIVGEGIVITLTDNEETSYDADDLLSLVNELRSAGAEAISINNQRIVNMSDIANVNYRYIMINNTRITSPYTVKAIGDKTYLKSALTIKNGYMDLKQKDEYEISIQEKSNIKINKYSEKVNLKYIKLD